MFNGLGLTPILINIKYSVSLILILSAALGLFQFLLIAGLIWNIAYPLFFIVALGIAMAYRKKKKPRYTRFLLWTMLMLFVFELVFKFVLEERNTHPENGKEISVITYNIFFKNKDPFSTSSLIKNQDPDILIVQELTPRWAQIIENQLGKKYRYQSIIPLRGTHGLGVYSKYPIQESNTLYNNNKLPYAQLVNLIIHGKHIQLINAHLASPAVAVENKDKFFSLYYTNYQTRKRQLNQINDAAKNEREKFTAQLLVGDLNTLSYEPIFKKLKTSWVNGFAASGKGWGLNFPNSGKIRPVLTLDYIMAKGKLEFIETHVVKGGSSDHLPIISRVKI